MNKLEMIEILDKTSSVLEQSADFIENLDAVNALAELKKVRTQLLKEHAEGASQNLVVKSAERPKISTSEEERKLNPIDEARDMPQLIAELYKANLLDEEDLANIRTLQKASGYYRDMLGDIPMHK